MNSVDIQNRISERVFTIYPFCEITVNHDRTVDAIRVKTNLFYKGEQLESRAYISYCELEAFRDQDHYIDIISERIVKEITDKLLQHR